MIQASVVCLRDFLLCGEDIANKDLLNVSGLDACALDGGCRG